MKTEALQQQSSIDFEPFYEALEDNPKLLEEALEILLDMVDFEPKSIKKVALISKRIREIYIMK
jgi:hypothetical protein